MTGVENIDGRFRVDGGPSMQGRIQSGRVCRVECDDARVSLFDYMEVFYNRQRRHSSISYEAPLPFEAMKSPGKVSTVRG